MKSVINLVRTTHGFSIVEDNQQINKITSKTKEKSFSVSKKLAQHNYTIYPYISMKDLDNQKYILLPARTQWFNLNSVHEIQKKALPEWFKIKKGIMASMSNIKFEKHEELYKKYRNHIIQLGKQTYLTPSHSRKGLAGDASAIIRIHKFLEKWGLINYIHKNQKKQETQEKTLDNEKSMPLSKRKDCLDKDKLIVSRTYGKDDVELLKKISRKFRPICHFCEGIAGIEWYQFKRKINHKYFQKNQNKKGKIICRDQNSYQFQIILCTSCIYQQNFPIILNSKDFVKKTIFDDLQEQFEKQVFDKKRSNQHNKIAEAIQKNRFKIYKTAQQLKMTPEYVFKSLMSMPCQKLQKISRIQPETDSQKTDVQIKENKITQLSKLMQQSQKANKKLFSQRLQLNLLNLQNQGRQQYELFLQSWLLKIHAKMQKLYDWQNMVQTKLKSVQRVSTNNLAEKIQHLYIKR